MKIVTKKEFVNWIKEQPDDRLVDMMETCSDQPCGCVMVQYGKDVFKLDIDYIWCGGRKWWSERSTLLGEFDDSVTNIWDLFEGAYSGVKNVSTFGELKPLIKN